MSINPHEISKYTKFGNMQKGWTINHAREVVANRLTARNEDEAGDRGIIQYDNSGQMFIVIRYGNVALQEIACDDDCWEGKAFEMLTIIREKIREGALDDEIMSVRRRRYANAA